MAAAHPTLELLYFDTVGRAEPIRNAFRIGNVPFTDTRLSGEDFGARKAAGDFPFGQVPALLVDGAMFAQSGAILRYAGVLAGLYPSDPTEALFVDQVCDAWYDMQPKLVAIAFNKDEEAKAALIAAATAEEGGWLAPGVEKIGALIKGDFFAGANATIADVLSLNLVNFIGMIFGEGALAGSPLPALAARVAELPGVPSS